ERTARLQKGFESLGSRFPGETHAGNLSEQTDGDRRALAHRGEHLRFGDRFARLAERRRGTLRGRRLSFALHERAHAPRHVGGKRFLALADLDLDLHLLFLGGRAGIREGERNTAEGGRGGGGRGG